MFNANIHWFATWIYLTIQYNDAVGLQTRIRNDSKDTTHLSSRVRGRGVRHVARRVVLDLSSVERAVPTEMVGVHVGGIRHVRHLQPDQRRGIHRVSVQDGVRGYALGNHGVHVVGDVGLREVLKKRKRLSFGFSWLAMFSVRVHVQAIYIVLLRSHLAWTFVVFFFRGVHSVSFPKRSRHRRGRPAAPTEKTPSRAERHGNQTTIRHVYTDTMDTNKLLKLETKTGIGD